MFLGGFNKTSQIVNQLCSVCWNWSFFLGHMNEYKVNHQLVIWLLSFYHAAKGPLSPSAGLRPLCLQGVHSISSVMKRDMFFSWNVSLNRFWQVANILWSWVYSYGKTLKMRCRIMCRRCVISEKEWVYTFFPRWCWHHGYSEQKGEMYFCVYKGPPDFFQMVVCIIYQTIISKRKKSGKEKACLEV